MSLNMQAKWALTFRVNSEQFDVLACNYLSPSECCVYGNVLDLW